MGAQYRAANHPVDANALQPWAMGLRSAAPWWKSWRSARPVHHAQMPAEARAPAVHATQPHSPASPTIDQEQDAFLDRLRQAGL